MESSVRHPCGVGCGVWGVRNGMHSNTSPYCVDAHEYSEGRQPQHEASDVDEQQLLGECQPFVPDDGLYCREAKELQCTASCLQPLEHRVEEAAGTWGLGGGCEACDG